MNNKTDRSLIPQRLDALRVRMREEGITLYLLTKTDFHLSEEPGAYFNTLEYMSGFTGSNGTMVVTHQHAHLWTDGRYTLQAREELRDTGITVHISSDYNDDIGTVPLFFGASGDAFYDAMVDDGIKRSTFDPQKFKTVIGCDGRTIPFEMLDEIIENLGIAFDSGAVVINAKVDLVGDIWPDRPPLPDGKAWVLEDRYAGESVRDKLDRVRDVIESYSSDTGAVITALDDIAWLFNLRGSDMDYSLTVLAYAYVNATDAYLFIDSRKLTGKVITHLRAADVTIRGYDEFYSFLDEAPDHFVIVDPSRNNAAVVVTVGDNPETSLINHYGLVEDLKAIKNDTERTNAAEVHRRDAVAMIRFIKWVKENVGKVRMTERSAADYLEFLRREQGMLCLSFPTICAYGPHAAIVHYLADETTDVPIEPAGMLLVDSGAHYLGGTTDITRTIPLGALTDEMRKCYTLCLASFLELLNARFPRGLYDTQVDVFARAPMWRHGLEFEHGTGHGVGTMLNVHEGPQSITWLKSGDSIVMRDGMITSCEPGIYFEGKFGVRHENLMLCTALRDYPGFLGFTSLTLVPIDTSAVDPEYLTDAEVDMLNRYNRMVYLEMLPYLTVEEQAWLQKETAPVSKAR